MEMDIKNYIVEKTQKLLRSHGINNWNVSFGKRKRALGLTKYSEKTIEYSNHWVPIMKIQAIDELIIHEVAHALTPGAKHGMNWRMTCLILGGEPEQVSNVSNIIDSDKDVSFGNKYTLVCPKCGQQSFYNRKLKINRSCGICGVPGVYDPAFKMNLIQNY